MTGEVKKFTKSNNNKSLTNKNIIFFLCLLFTIIFIFRNYFFAGKIPFSSNLLVSFYQPWASYRFPGWEHGIPNKPLGVDNLRIYYPQRIFTNNLLKKREIPFWSPYNFSGNVHLAKSETAIFYPLNLIYFLINSIDAWSILVIVQPFLAAIFMFLFLEILTKHFFWASFFGAFTFSFSGFMIARMEDGLVRGHAIIWLPLVLYAFEKWLQSSKNRFLLLAIFALSCSVLAGWFQFTFYVFLISFIYLFLRLFLDSGEKRFFRQKVSLLILPFLAVFFLTAFHTFPALRAFSLSPRSGGIPEEFLEKHLMPPYHLLTYLIPDFWGNPGAYNFFGRSEYQESILFIGIIPLFFALYTLENIKKNKKVELLFCLSLIGLFLGLDFPITRLILRIPLPIISSFLPARSFFIATFCFSVLASLGVKRFLQEKKENKKWQKVIIATFGAVFFLATVHTGLSYFKIYGKCLPGSIKSQILDLLAKLGVTFTGKYGLEIRIRNLILPLLTFFILLPLPLLKSKFRFPSFLFYFIVTLLFQIYFANKYLYFSEREFIFPPHPVFSELKKRTGLERFIGYGQGYIASNFSTYYELFSPEGVDAMYPSYYGELISALENKGEIKYPLPRIEARIKPLIEFPKDWVNLYLERFMQITGTKYVVGLKDPSPVSKVIPYPPKERYRLVWENEDWQIYEFKDALPRIYWASNYKVAKDKKSHLQALFDPKTSLKDSVVLWEEPQGLINNGGDGEIEVVNYSPNRIRLKVKAENPGFIYLSDTYYPEWEALVDGKKEKIYQANYAFRAIPILEKGEHKVDLYFSAITFKLGTLISSLSFLILLIIVFHKVKFYEYIRIYKSKIFKFKR